ncbi:MAG TPA: hypothetical protein VFF27_00150 [Bacteroidia bacterium]|jgi:hypothetical protein|nr:hypothetical protein [Bacteroidia bacterium]
MSLSITFRPQKDLYAVNPPDVYDEAYYNSRWVSGHLPIQYKILNTKWPTNSDDTVDNICAVSDVNGFAEINLCGTYNTYLEKEYIKIDDSTVDSYNGVWQVLSVVNATTIIISAFYDGSATATFQRYYNNYHNLVKVYAGIPEYHQFESEDEMSLIATLKIQPNESNLSIADISGLIKAKLNCDNDLDQLSTPNDLNAWTGFYIDYAESYDVSDGDEVTQYTSDYTTDAISGCVAGELVTNGSFTTNLNDWSSLGSGSTWVYDAGKASATRGINSNSKGFAQELEFILGLEYRIQATITNNEANVGYLYVSLSPTTSLAESITILFQEIGSGANTIDFNMIPQADHGVIYFSVTYGGSSTQKLSIDNVSVTAPSCTYYGFAINGTRQFQNTIGGNFGDYVQNFNTEGVLNNFLTKFVSPIWFNSLYFDLSTIIPKSTFSATSDNQLYYYIKEYTEGGGFIQRQDITIESKDDGVYRLPISDLTLDSSTDYFDLQIYQLPTNRLTDANNGTFEYTTDGAGSPPSDWGMSIGVVGDLLQSNLFAHSGTYSLEITTNTSYSVGQHSMFSTISYITVEENSDYIIEGYVLKNSLNTQYNGSTVYLTPIGITPTLINSFQITSENGAWNYIKTVFNTGANTTVAIRLILSNTSLVTSEDMVLYLDDVTVKGPVENLSEVKTIQVDNTCTKQNIYLSWLNNLGQWEYYNFKAQKDYGIDIGKPKSITRDVLVNWDTDFISGETQDDYISVEANETIAVRSQFMSLEELQAVVQIMYAIRVQEIRSDNTKITVLVDKKSIKKYSDGDRMYAIEFDITYPKIEIQTQ